MPISVIVTILVIMIIVAIICFVGSYCEDEAIGYIIGGILLVLVTGIAIWMGLVSDQSRECMKYSKIYLYDDGMNKVQYVVNTDNTITNLNETYGGILPEDAIIEIWQYNKYSGGIDWENDKPQHKIIYKESEGYEEAFKKLQQQK